MNVCFDLATTQEETPRVGRMVWIVGGMRGEAMRGLPFRELNRVTLKTAKVNTTDTHHPVGASTQVAVGSRVIPLLDLDTTSSPAFMEGRKTIITKSLPISPTRNICSITILSPTLFRTQSRTPIWPESSTALKGSRWFIIDCVRLVFLYLRLYIIINYLNLQFAF